MLIEVFLQEIRLLQPLHPQVHRLWKFWGFVVNIVFGIFSVMDPDTKNVQMDHGKSVSIKKNRLNSHLLVLFKSLSEFSKILRDGSESHPQMHDPDPV